LLSSEISDHGVPGAVAILSSSHFYSR